MLTIVYGRAGAGKTAYCIKDAESHCGEGQECIILVPEQSSFSAERAIAFEFPQNLRHLISVKTFTSLCTDIMGLFGGIAKERISEPARVAMVRRAVISMNHKLEYYRRHRKSNSFYVLLAQAITELKNSGVTTALLRSAAEKTQDATLSLKMNEIAGITDCYDQLLGNSTLDTIAAIDLAAELGKSGYFRGKTIYIDDFSGFTVPELNIISRMLTDCTDVFCTLCTESIEPGNTGRMSLSSDSARSLIHRAEESCVPITSVMLSNAGAYNADGPRFLEKYLSEGITDVPGYGLFASQFDSLYSEAAGVAAEIAKLVRERKYDPGDITVISRKTETYLPVLESVFTKYDIPYYTDATDSLAYSPVTIFFRCGLELADGISTPRIISLIKTGLTPISDEEAPLLENYAYTWDLDASQWTEPFTGSPSGFGEPNQTELTILSEINTAREKVCGILKPFSERLSASKNGGEILSAVYTMFEDCGAYETIEKQSSDSVNEASAATAMITQFYNIVREDEITPSEMIDLLSVLAYSTPLESVPIMGGRVNLCDAVRSRTDNPKTVFVMGLNEGVFPADISEPQILGYTERRLLSELGITMPENFEINDAAERYYLYKALTSPTDSIYLSCSGSDLEGGRLSPSAEFISVTEDLKPRHFASIGVPYFSVVNDSTAMAGYATAIASDNDVVAATIESIYPKACSEARTAAQSPRFSIDEKGLTYRLVGEESSLSASRIEAYERCPFSYFMRYMMGIKPVGRAEINPIEAGNLVHWTLEQTMRRFDGDFRNVSENALINSAFELSSEYAIRNMGDEYGKARQAYLIGRISDQIGKLLIHIREEQLQSRFMPVDYELGIGENQEIPPMTLLTDDGHKVSVNGKIDRVDLFKNEDGLYLRVIDYKTGNKEFKLDEVYDGLSIQMLLYLFTVCENGETRYGTAPLPAAVLYMPGDPGLSEDQSGDGSDAIKSYCTDGVILNNDEIIAAMEQNLQGIYIPVTTSNGEIKITDRLASPEMLKKMKERIKIIIKNMATGIYAGDISPNPYGKTPSDNRICDSCDYSTVCRSDRVEKFRTPSIVNNLFEEVSQ